MTEDLTKKCPFCAEEIKAEAIKCRFCRETLEGAGEASSGSPAKEFQETMTVVIPFPAGSRPATEQLPCRSQGVGLPMLASLSRAYQHEIGITGAVPGGVSQRLFGGATYFDFGEVASRVWKTYKQHFVEALNEYRTEGWELAEPLEPFDGMGRLIFEASKEAHPLKQWISGAEFLLGRTK